MTPFGARGGKTMTNPLCQRSHHLHPRLLLQKEKKICQIFSLSNIFEHSFLIDKGCKVWFSGWGKHRPPVVILQKDKKLLLLSSAVLSHTTRTCTTFPCALILSVLKLCLIYWQNMKNALFLSLCQGLWWNRQLRAVFFFFPKSKMNPNQGWFFLSVDWGSSSDSSVLMQSNLLHN